jgi:Tol biopolymer transport system component
MMNTQSLRNLFSALLLMVICLAPGKANAAPQSFSLEGQIERVSVAADGTEGNTDVSDDGPARISANGEYVIFSSIASNLVPGDTNGKYDVFLVDRWTKQISRISTGMNGAEANGNSLSEDMTPDGRYIVFYSNASNLILADTNSVGDVFVYDQMNHTIVRVSVGTEGQQGDGNSAEGHISDNGRYMVFSSLANSFSSETGGFDYDIFVRDRDTDANGIFDEPDETRTFRVSTGANGQEPDYHGSGSQRPDISGNGRYISFMSTATNLVDPPETDSFLDVYYFDRDADGNNVFDEIKPGGTSVTRVTIDPEGNPANENTYLDENAPMSYDGHYIVFPSDASNLVADDSNGQTDIFRRDMITGETVLVSVGPGSAAALGDSYEPSITNDGRYITFQSQAENLVTNDTNGWDDCFVNDMQAGDTTLVSLAWDASQGNSSSGPCFIAPSGQGIVFLSRASNLVPGKTNKLYDLFAIAKPPFHTYLPVLIR